VSYRRILVLLGLIACASAAHPRTADSCLNRSVVVSVTDKKGNPVLNLQAANFRGQAGGEEITIVSAEPAPAPRRIVILMDTSGSMLENLPVAKNVVLDVLSAAPPQAKIAFMTFAEKVDVKVDFTGSRVQIADALKSLTPRKRTALNDALIAGLRWLDSPGPDDLVFLITDAGNNVGKTTDKQLRQALRAANVRVLTFMFSEREPVTPEEVFGEPDLSYLIHETGGTVAAYDSGWLKGAKPDQLQLAVNMLLAQAVYAYRLGIRLTAPIDTPKRWGLKVVNVPEKIKGPRIAYPDELMPCTNTGSISR
jgi:VWA domain-containing protein